jgi:hypothetical protein
MSDERSCVARLEGDGLVRREAGVLRTTRRWQAAMARAAARLSAGDRDDDLRAPIAGALIELYGEALDEEALVDLIHAILPIEIAELAPG